MAIRFHSPCVFVSDMARARAFYEGCLGQVATLSLDGYVVYQGFSLWQGGKSFGHIFGEAGRAGCEAMGSDNFELYFETEAIDSAWERVSSQAAPIHPVREQPWGQRCFRVRDPDGHILEVAEPMEAVFRRMDGMGKSVEEISALTMMPLPFVRQTLEKN